MRARTFANGYDHRAGLVRYGGLRCPSEVHQLEWRDVDFENQILKVRTHKTAYRELPMFPEIAGHIADARDRAPEGASWVVPIHRHRSGRALYSAFRNRIERVQDVTRWPKLFVNLRASRETELAEQFPMHVVTYWLGNSPTVAASHYLRVTRQHQSQAVGGPSPAEKPRLYNE